MKPACTCTEAQWSSQEKRHLDGRAGHLTICLNRFIRLLDIHRIFILENPDESDRFALLPDERSRPSSNYLKMIVIYNNIKAVHHKNIV